MKTGTVIEQNNLKVLVVTDEEMNKVIETREDINGHQRYINREGDKWVAVDNETGDAWTEEFHYYTAAMEWLTESEDTAEEINQHEQAGHYHLVRQDIREIVRCLAKSQGTYSRLNATFEVVEEEMPELYDEAMTEVEEMKFKTVVDLILFFEC